MIKRLVSFALAVVVSVGASAQQGGIFGTSYVPPAAVATYTIGTTPGNAVSPYALGYSWPGTESEFNGQPPASGATFNVPTCGTTGMPPCGQNTILHNLLNNLTTVSGGRALYLRAENDATDPYDWSCLNIPLGQPIVNGWSTSGGTLTLNANNTLVFTGNGDGTDGVISGFAQTTNLESGLPRVGQTVTGSSITGGTATITAVAYTGTSGSIGTVTLSATVASGAGTFTAQNIIAGDTGYVHSFGSVAATTAGINNPETPQNASTSTPYTVSAATTSSITITGLTYTGSQSGTDNGYFTLTSMWGSSPTQAQLELFCSPGNYTVLNPPLSLQLNQFKDLLINGPASMVASFGTSAAHAQYCNGHREGPYYDKVGNLAPAVDYCLPTVETQQYLTAFAGNLGLIQAFEYGNEPDSYYGESINNGWYYRPSNYTVYSNGATQVGILTPGSGQTNGTYTITSSNPSCGSGTISTCAAISLTIAGGVCTSATITQAGVGYFGAGAAVTVPQFTVTEGGTPCTIEASNDAWINNFYDVAQANNPSTMSGIGWVGPSTANTGFNYQIMGGANSSSTVFATPPTWPNNTDLIGWGLRQNSLHEYLYASDNFCPSYSISSVARTCSGSTGGINVTTSTGTNFTVPINLTAATYNSGTGYITGTLANLDTITSHTASTSISYGTTKFTFTCSSTPQVAVGNLIQVNGTTDTTLNGKALFVTSITGNVISASYPYFYDSKSTDTSGGYDQLYLYSGSKATISGNSNSTYNLAGVTIAASGSTTQPATVTFTTSTFTAPSGTACTSTCGSFVMTGNDQTTPLTGLFEAISDTPLGANGTSLDVQPIASSVYTWPPVNSAGNAYPFYGSYTAGSFGSANWRAKGALPLTWTSTTSATWTNTSACVGVADSASSGILNIVTGTSTSNTNNEPVAKANCNPTDLLTSPLSSQHGPASGHAASENMIKGLSQQFPSYPYTSGSPYGAIPFRINEHQSMSPSENPLTSTFQQALWKEAEAIQNLTYAGYLGTTNSSGNTYSNPAPMSGIDGFNMFTASGIPYASWSFNNPVCSGSPVTCTYALSDSGSNGNTTASGVGPSYYAMYALFDWLKTNTNWVQVTGSGQIPGLVVQAVKDSQSPPHYHIKLVNKSQAATGNVNIVLPGASTAQENISSTTNVPALTFNAYAQSISGTTMTFCVPTAAVSGYTGIATNLMYNMPLTLSGFTNTNLNGLATQVISHGSAGTACSGLTFTATVPTGSYTSSDQGTATVQCSLGALCHFGVTYGGSSTITWDGSTTGLPIGTVVPYTLSATYGTFSLNIPPFSSVVLDAH